MGSPGLPWNSSAVAEQCRGKWGLASVEFPISPEWNLWESASNIRHLASVKGEQNIYQTWKDQKL